MLWFDGINQMKTYLCKGRSSTRIHRVLPNLLLLLPSQYFVVYELDEVFDSHQTEK